MSKIVIIGEGDLVAAVTQTCAAFSDNFSNITLASPCIDLCDAIAQSVLQTTGAIINTATIATNNVPALTLFLKTLSPKLLINLGVVEHKLQAMEACLGAGIHYMDAIDDSLFHQVDSGYQCQWDYHQRFKQAGLTALLGAGLTPGVTNMFTAHLAKHYFDEIYDLNIIGIHCNDGDSASGIHCQSEDNLSEVLTECKHWEVNESLKHEDSLGADHFVKTPPMSKRAQFTCPEDWGEYPIYRLYHEELESLTKHFPTLKRAQFWMSFDADDTQHMIKVSRGSAVNDVGYTSEPVSREKVFVGCVITGIKSGITKTFYCYSMMKHDSCDTELEPQSISYVTGVPCMISAKMMLEEKWNKPGVFNMEQHDPEPFLREMNVHGLNWKVLELNNVLSL